MDMSQEIVALGLMSGTSLDGVDVAFLKTDGQRISAFGPALTMPYTAEDRATLTTATQAALRWQFSGPRPHSFTQVETVIHRTHIRAVKALCAQAPEWADNLAIIGFHGQTMLHLPAQNETAGQTLQLGDGAALARECGVPVVYDFRSADVARGGQGAPLVPIYHKALVDYAGLSGRVAILNLGGVGNVTLIGGNSGLMASDTGPGNGPLDTWVEVKSGQGFDTDGVLSRAGLPHFSIIDQWLNQGFFKRSLPRSADRYDFDVMSDIEIEGLSLEDGAATLAAFTAQSVAQTLSQMGAEPDMLILCGGGRHNTAMRWMLKSHLSANVVTAEHMGWESDAIEAQAFAYMAVRHVRGLPISFPETTGVPRPMAGGVLVRP